LSDEIIDHSPACFFQDGKAGPIRKARLFSPINVEPSLALPKDSEIFPALPMQVFQRDRDPSSQCDTLMPKDKYADGRGWGAPKNATTLKRRRNENEPDLSAHYCERERKYRSRSTEFALI
jgi:hypothetical protein